MKGFSFCIIVVLSLLLSPSCFAGDPWSKEDVARQVLVTSLLAVDMQQTLYIKRNQDKFYETNPAIPMRDKDIYTHFAVSAIMWALVADAMPSEQRKYFQYLTIGFQGATIRSNKMIGIKVQF